MVPRTVLTRSGLISLNTARPVNTVQSRTAVNNAGPMKNIFNNVYSTARRPFNKITAANNSNFTKKVNTVNGTRVSTARPKVVLSAVKGNKGNAVKASAYPSQHMTGNRSYLTDYEEIDGGFVAFGGNPKGGKFTRKDFKLTDESHVLLKVPRKDNMYSVDLKNVVPQGGLTCLFAKATPDKSNLWHKRLGHVNFKTMNKLVRGNLVRGLPSNFFEINQTCVACQKGKQDRASCKTKTVSSISQPLQMLHMDLFGPTFVNSLMKKMYCLVVTDKFSRCDNRTEFKNRVMNQFCKMKGIKKEFIVARTLQKNRVVERKNTTLIEAARTMLADSKLPTNFWAEAVNTACYVQNRVLVIKPHNKTPYELFLGRKPALSFMRPFECPVTILNSKDQLGNQSNGSADPSFSSSLNDSPDDGFKPSGEEEKKDAEDPGNKDSEVPSTEKPREDQGVNQEKNSNANSTNTINTVSSTINAASLEDNTANKNIVYGCADYSNMSKLEEIGRFSDAEDVDSGVDMNNLDTYIFIEAMQEELLQFKLQKVWTLVDLPNGKRAIGIKWVYNNKKDERGIVIKNKARLVAQGYTQVEGIDYDEVFAPVARIEAIRLFLAFALFKGFAVYQMDVNSAFLYGKIEEEVYVCQPLGFEDLNFPDRVYKVEKALYGLHQAPRAWYETLSTYLLDNGFQRGTIDKTLFIKRDKGEQVQQMKDGIFISQDKYVAEILKKFGFSDVKTASTPMETSKHLLKDADGEDVYEHLYRSMIRSLMYLTSSRPGQPKLGLWYLKDSSFDLVAYTDSDYAGASLDRKSTTGGCQFLGCKLLSWQCKKHTVVANSTTEAEYIAASNYYRQECLIFNVMILGWNDDWNGVQKLLRLELGLKLFADAHNMVAYLEKSMENADFAEIVDFLNANPIRTKSMATLNDLSPQGTGLGSGPRCQDTILEGVDAQTRFETASKQSNDLPILRVNTLRSGEDRLKLKELMELCTKLSDKVLDLETTKIAQAKEIANLRKRIKKLERGKKSKTNKLKRLYKIGSSRRVESSKEASLGDQEDASKQGRIDDIDADINVTLVNETLNDEDIFRVNDLDGEKVIVNEEVVKTVDEEITLAQTLIEIKNTKPKAKGIVMEEPSESTPIISLQQPSQVLQLAHNLHPS
ncbi:putative ribonuclease H-like domain-containing protein [Tanacetum coccineum]